MTGPAHIFDKPNRYIGKPEPRADAARLLQGRGSYVDDKKLPRMAHAAFVRSPHAHAKILSIDTEGARAATGVVAVYSGEDLAKHVTPYVGTLTHLGWCGWATCAWHRFGRYRTKRTDSFSQPPAFTDPRRFLSGKDRAALHSPQGNVYL
ncbi:MAG: hypothetical protein HOD77_03255 [Planktomarina temperata]|nr:hypothetical protein [Planktomarina temperata]